MGIHSDFPVTPGRADIPPSREEPIAFLRWAAQWLHEYDPDLVMGGCAEVSASLKALADRVGISGVQVVCGHALFGKKGKRKVNHAWLTVSGQLFDPTYTVLCIHPTGYAAVDGMDIYNPFGVRDDTVDGYVVPTLLAELSRLAG